MTSLSLADATSEPAAWDLAARTSLGDQLEAALTRFGDQRAFDDEGGLRFADLLDLSTELDPRDDSPVPLLESESSLAFVVRILATLRAGRVPVLAQPGALDGNSLPTDLPNGTALLLTSGGTTGTPKLIARGHAEYLVNVWLSARNLELGESDVVLLPIPVAHNYALACPGVLGAILHGASFVVTRARRTPDLVPIVDRHGVSVLPLVPTQARFDNAVARPKHPVRLVQVGGSPVTADDVRRLRAQWGGQVQASFGMAEGLLCQSAPGDSDDLREASIGRTLSERDEYRIVDADATDGAGLLEVRGPYTIERYVASDEVNAAKFTPDGWFRTGDHAIAVTPRRFRVIGRADDVINRGGELIDPTAVEQLVRAHPGVLDVAAAGEPHRTFGQIATAFAVLAEDVGPDTVLLDLLREHGDVQQVPDRLVAVDTIPVTSVGKVDRQALLTLERTPR